MTRYKNLILILVIIGSIQLIAQYAFMYRLTRGPIELVPPLAYLPNLVYLKVIIWIPASIWIYKDSKKNLFGPWLWAFLTLIATYEGVIIYLLTTVLFDREKMRDSSLRSE